MVNVIIGSGAYIGGTSTTLAGVSWDGNAKNLVVEVDTKGLCTNFIEISNQPFTYVPFAFYAENSGTPGLQGPAGPQGPQGVTGPQGLNGTTGPQGVPGNQGVQGVVGQNGLDGKNSLIKTSIELAGANCVNGGVKVEVGLDSNNNNILDNSEINNSATKFVCNGVNGSNLTTGSSNYYQVQQLYNNPNGPSIAANGYYNPLNYPFQVVHTYDNLNAVEFEFNMINSVYRCFKLVASFKFYDINNNLVSVLYNDKEEYISNNGSSTWSSPVLVNDIGNSTNPSFLSMADNNTGSGFEIIVLERNIKIKTAAVVKKVEIIFNTSNIYVNGSASSGHTCNSNDYNGPITQYAGYYGTIGYQFLSFGN
jgi:hypothetical protein